MNSDQLLSSQGLSNYPSIKAFSKLVGLTTKSNNVPLSAQILLDLCRNVARDLTYVSRLHEDAQRTLNACPAYHAQWTDEVRIAAAQALYRANRHIESKLPDTEALYQLTCKGKPSELQSKVLSVVTASKKDTEDIGGLLAHLSATHASLMGVVGLMQQLAFRSGDLLPDAVKLESFRSLSVESLGRMPPVSPIQGPVEETNVAPSNQ